MTGPRYNLMISKRQLIFRKMTTTNEALYEMPSTHYHNSVSLPTIGFKRLLPMTFRTTEPIHRSNLDKSLQEDTVVKVIVGVVVIMLAVLITAAFVYIYKVCRHKHMLSSLFGDSRGPRITTLGSAQFWAGGRSSSQKVRNDWRDNTAALNAILLNGATSFHTGFGMRKQSLIANKRPAPAAVPRMGKYRESHVASNQAKGNVIVSPSTATGNGNVGRSSGLVGNMGDGYKSTRRGWGKVIALREKILNQAKTETPPPVWGEDDSTTTGGEESSISGSITVHTQSHRDSRPMFHKEKGILSSSDENLHQHQTHPGEMSSPGSSDIWIKNYRPARKESSLVPSSHVVVYVDSPDGTQKRISHFS